MENVFGFTANNIVRADETVKSETVSKQPFIVLNVSKERMKSDLKTLTSDDFEGRKSGEEGAKKAAAFLEKELRTMKLLPLGENGTFLQFFPLEFENSQESENIKTAENQIAADSPSMNENRKKQSKSEEESEFDQENIPQDMSEIEPQTQEKRTLQGENVIAVLPGRDPLLKDEYILIGAHFDHVGRGKKIQKKGEAQAQAGKIYPGANDNASGTAMVLELARQFSKKAGLLSTQTVLSSEFDRKTSDNKENVESILRCELSEQVVFPRRSIIFAFWGAEEQGLIGSRYFVKYPTVDLKKVKLFIGLDMVGNMEDNELWPIGYRSGTGLRKQMNGAANALSQPLNLRYIDYLWPNSDHYPFYRKKIPAMLFFTGFTTPYHNPADTVENLDLDEMTQIAFFMQSFVLNLDALDDDFPVFRKAEMVGVGFSSQLSDEQQKDELP